MLLNESIHPLARALEAADPLPDLSTLLPFFSSNVEEIANGFPERICSSHLPQCEQLGRILQHHAQRAVAGVPLR